MFISASVIFYRLWLKMDDERCILNCDQDLSDGGPIVTLTEKGSNSINKASEARGTSLRTQAGQRVHTECRKRYTNPKYITVAQKKQRLSSSPTCLLRSLLFNFKEHCIFCGQPAKCLGEKHGGDVYPVRTMDFQVSVLQICEERRDYWSNTVAGRLACVADLHAADAIYHQTCSVNFRTGRRIPQQYSSNAGESMEKRQLGRPEEFEKKQAFLEVAKYLEENDDEQITVTDLVEKMEEYLDQSECQPYIPQYMKTKLQEHFGFYREKG